MKLMIKNEQDTGGKKKNLEEILQFPVGRRGNIEHITLLLTKVEWGGGASLKLYISKESLDVIPLPDLFHN